jgi:hypothetical protein
MPEDQQAIVPEGAENPRSIVFKFNYGHSGPIRQKLPGVFDEYMAESQDPKTGEPRFTLAISIENLIEKSEEHPEIIPIMVDSMGQELGNNAVIAQGNLDRYKEAKSAFEFKQMPGDELQKILDEEREFQARRNIEGSVTQLMRVYHNKSPRECYEKATEYLSKVLQTISRLQDKTKGAEVYLEYVATKGLDSEVMATPMIRMVNGQGAVDAFVQSESTYSDLYQQELQVLATLS